MNVSVLLLEEVVRFITRASVTPSRRPRVAEEMVLLGGATGSGKAVALGPAVAAAPEPGPEGGGDASGPAGALPSGWDPVTGPAGVSPVPVSITTEPIAIADEFSEITIVTLPVAHTKAKRGCWTDAGCKSPLWEPKGESD